MPESAMPEPQAAQQSRSVFPWPTQMPFIGLAENVMKDVSNTITGAMERNLKIKRQKPSDSSERPCPFQEVEADWVACCVETGVKSFWSAMGPAINKKFEMQDAQLQSHQAGLEDHQGRIVLLEQELARLANICRDLQQQGNDQQREENIRRRG